jgi:hypothetical protein
VSYRPSTVPTADGIRGPGWARFPNLPGGPAGRVTRETLHRIPACIIMHRRSPAKLPDVCRDPPAPEVSLTAASATVLVFLQRSMPHFARSSHRTERFALRDLLEASRVHPGGSMWCQDSSRAQAPRRAPLTRTGRGPLGFARSTTASSIRPIMSAMLDVAELTGTACRDQVCGTYSCPIPWRPVGVEGAVWPAHPKYAANWNNLRIAWVGQSR